MDGWRITLPLRMEDGQVRRSCRWTLNGQNVLRSAGVNAWSSIGQKMDEFIGVTAGSSIGQKMDEFIGVTAGHLLVRRWTSSYCNRWVIERSEGGQVISSSRLEKYTRIAAWTLNGQKMDKCTEVATWAWNGQKMDKRTYVATWAWKIRRWTSVQK